MYGYSSIWRWRNSDELYHHEIKGQKWGVRRGPPYPIEDTIMRTGTRVNSINTTPYKNENNSDRWRYTYNPDDNWDSSVYKGPFAVYLMQTKGLEVFEHQYETIKNLRMPTSKERLDEFIAAYNANKLRSFLELRSMQKKMVCYKVGTEKSRTIDLNQLKTEDDYKAAYEVFNHLMERAWEYGITRRYCKTMSEKYDAMVDDNNQEIYNHAHDPVIIFKVKEALKEIGNVKMIDVSEARKHFEKVQLELAKKGEKVLL